MYVEQALQRQRVERGHVDAPCGAVPLVLRRSDRKRVIGPDPGTQLNFPIDRALFLEEYAGTRLAETLGPVLFENLVEPLFLKQEPDAARVKDALDKTPTVLDWIESQLGDGPVVGGRFPVADIALASPFVNWLYAGQRVDAARWPKLAAFLERTWLRPSFEARIEEEKAQMGV